MGALHEGHLQLVDRARTMADQVVASVFVNPLQFAPTEDWAAYPRDAARDQQLLAERGAAVLFLPSVAVMYPAPPAISLHVPELTRTLCGPHRPGHFEGVLTVVAKLFHLVEPDIAVFGRKDAQQAVLIQRLVHDLDFPVRIDVAPIVREANGLALSSRNAYLSPEQCRTAGVLSRALDAAHVAFTSGITEATDLLQVARKVLAGEPALRAQYVELVDPVSLAALSMGRPEALLAVAAFVGTTRLIDNIILGQGLAGDVRLG